MVQSIQLPWTSLVRGVNPSRDCGERGQAEFVGIIQLNRWNTLSRFLLRPTEGLLNLLYAKVIIIFRDSSGV